MFLWFTEKARIDIPISFENIVMFLTLFVLFASDIAQLTGSKAGDPAVGIIYSISLFIFIFEFFLATWLKSSITFVWPPEKWDFKYNIFGREICVTLPLVMKYSGYFFGFYFFLDAVAIFSLLPDISWIARQIGLESVSIAGGGGRVIRMVRLVRIVKLYKIAAEKAKNVSIENELMKLVRSGAITYETVEQRRSLFKNRESRLGSHLSEIMTQRIIVIVLIMLLCVPLLTQGKLLMFYTCNFHVLCNLLLIYICKLHWKVTADFAPEDSTEFLQNMNSKMDFTTGSVDIDVFNDQIASYVSFFKERKNRPYLLSLEVQPFDYTYRTEELDYWNGLRQANIHQIDYGSGESYVRAEFNKDFFMMRSAYLQIVLTIFVSLMLVSGSVYVNDDIQTIVLNPIERMMNMVDTIAKNPLDELKFSDTENSQYETRIIYSTIQKITGLLRVGFGVAGANIISSNLVCFLYVISYVNNIKII